MNRSLEELYTAAMCGVSMKTWDIRCGSVSGVISARSAAAGFRKLIRGAAEDSKFSELARFRQVKKRPKGQLEILSPWFYQEPLALQDDW